MFCRPASVGILAVALLQLGCATERPAAVTLSGVRAAEPVWLDPGAIVVTSPDAPAAFSFDRGNGQIETAKVRAQEHTRNLLTPPPMHPENATVAGAAGLAFSPIAALAGAVRGSTQRLEPEALGRAEQNLQRAMEAMATQPHLRDALVKTAAAQTHRRLLPMQALGNPKTENVPVSAVLESKIEELRLVRTGKGEDSFALRIKARARVLRASDGKVLYDEPFEYQSGTALFHDWTLATAVQNVANTGYRKLAERMTERLFLATRDEPTLVGAGFRKPFSPTPAPARQQQVATPTAPTSSGFTQVAYRFADSGTFGIYSTSSVGGLVIQAPKTKQEAVTEVEQLVDQRVREFDVLNNPAVAALALGFAVPYTLWNQTVACTTGLTEKRFAEASRNVRSAAFETRPHESLAFAVAQQLAPQTSQAVALVEKPQSTGDLYQAALMQCGNFGTLHALPRGVTPANYLVSQGMTKALEIHVTSAVLKGNGDINPPLTLHLEAIATVLRTSDGQALYSCPVRYQGKARKFTEWSDNNAKLLREEMARCYQELGQTIVTQLVARKVLPPKVGVAPLLATTQP